MACCSMSLPRSVAPQRLYGVGQVDPYSVDIVGYTDLVVAYLMIADKYLGPLPTRLRRMHQPVMSPPNRFATPRSTLLPSI